MEAIMKIQKSYKGDRFNSNGGRIWEKSLEVTFGMEGEKAFWSIIRGKYSVVGRNEYKAQEAKVLVRFFQLANNLMLRRKTEDK